MILDPQANSSLFQSRLLIIIKVDISLDVSLLLLISDFQDVIDADAEEIMKEYEPVFSKHIIPRSDSCVVDSL